MGIAALFIIINSQWPPIEEINQLNALTQPIPPRNTWEQTNWQHHNEDGIQKKYTEWQKSVLECLGLQDSTDNLLKKRKMKARKKRVDGSA